MFHVARVSDLLNQGFSKTELASQIAFTNQVTWQDLTLPKYIWTEEIMLEQFKHCPELIYVVLDMETLNVAASTTMLCTTFDRAMSCSSWEDISGYRTLSTHDPDGDTIFGIDLTVAPQHRLPCLCHWRPQERCTPGRPSTGVSETCCQAFYRGARFWNRVQPKNSGSGNQALHDRRLPSSPNHPELYG